MATLIECKGVMGKHYCDDPMQPPENFGKHPSTKNGRVGCCKTCKRGYDKDRYCPDRNREASLRQRYGIGVEDYNSLLDIQEGGCRICGWVPSKEKALCVDHDHDTGKVRGLLCTSCNLIVGHARDNPAVLLSSVAYLEYTGSSKESDSAWHPNPLVEEDPEAYFTISEVLDLISIRAQGEDLI